MISPNEEICVTLWPVLSGAGRSPETFSMPEKEPDTEIPRPLWSDLNQQPCLESGNGGQLHQRVLQEEPIDEG